ncbi:hypothetical protein GQ54DRAFT_304599 [Martensiomyces pterosporus]|nr:hypothetical protein GQ54DRAFT_304599 [Martensiomyces pterosporus]
MRNSASDTGAAATSTTAAAAAKADTPAKPAKPAAAAANSSTGKPARTGRGAKPHVPSACTNCKKAHLACDLQRPCRRCVNVGKCDTCKDVQHKKRGRPRSKDKKVSASGSEKSLMETQMFQFSFTSPASQTTTATAAPAAPSTTAAAALPTATPPTAHHSLPASPIPAPSTAATATAATATCSPRRQLAEVGYEVSALRMAHIPRVSQNQESTVTAQNNAPPTPHTLRPDNSNARSSNSSSLSMQQTSPAPFLPTMPEEPAAGSASTSYLFLTPSLLCLRLEELTSSTGNSASSRALLGHSLLSLINRSLVDFVSEHDQPRVQAVLDSMKHRLSTRLVRTTSRVYSHAILGQPPRAVDPNTFQALPIDRLLQRVCADISGDARAHLRTATGCYDLFDLHLYVGAVSSSAGPFDRQPASASVATTGLAQDEVYFVCRITKFDALSCASRLRSPVLPRIAMPPSFGASKSILRDTSADACERPAKRLCAPAAAPQQSANPPNPSDALYMLATVTDSDASSMDRHKPTQSSASSQSTVTSSPVLATPSPLLSASPRMGATLPPLSDLLRSIDKSNKLQYSSPSHSHSYSSHCMSSLNSI